MLRPDDECDGTVRHQVTTTQVFSRPGATTTARDDDSDNESVTSMLDSITHRHGLYKQPFIASRHTMQSDKENVDTTNVQTSEGEMELTAAGKVDEGARGENEGSGGDSSSDGNSDFSYLRAPAATPPRKNTKKAETKQGKKGKQSKKSTKKRRAKVAQGAPEEHRMVITPDTSEGLQQVRP
jgi:hypothetical protein